jgi:hypothetical protein
VDAKADQATTYTETEVNNLLDDKADQATTYTKTDVDSADALKANLDSPTFTGTVTAPTFSGAGTSLTGTATGLNAGIGVGQTWQDVTASRSEAVIYTNNTGKPIQVSITVSSSPTHHKLLVDGIIVSKIIDNAVAYQGSITAIVPNACTYKYTGGTPDNWAELR